VKPSQASIERWIRPEHLEPRAIKAVRRAFLDHPGRLIVMRCFLVDPIAAQISAFLQSDVATRPMYGLFSRRAGEHVSARAWRAAAPADRAYRFHVIAGLRGMAPLSPRLLTFLKMRRAFGERGFSRFVEHLSGLRLGTGTFDAHLMTRGDFLAPHDDAIDDRRVACVIFFGRKWDPGFGGALTVRSRTGDVWVVEPEFNTLVIFDVTAGTDHSVQEVRGSKGLRRASLSGWISNRQN
jgi:hypothetical protein